MRSAFNIPRRGAAYEGKSPFIFISHSHQDMHRVKEYIEGFDKAGFRIWYDNGIFTGANWPEARAQRMQECECVICFISNGSINSFEMADELRFAQALKKCILLVYLEECNLPSSLEMKCSLLQSYHVGTQKKDKDILDALCSSDILQKCQSDAASHIRASSPFVVHASGLDEAFKHVVMQGDNFSYKDYLREYLQNMSEQHTISLNIPQKHIMIDAEYPRKGTVKKRKMKREELE